MQRINSGLVGAVLVSAVIGSGVAFGADAPLASPTKDASPTEKRVDKPSTTIGTPAVAVVTKSTTPEQEGVDQFSADEQAILLTGATYLKAYADADAQAIAAHFTVDAEFIDEQGDVHQGREAIAKAMTACFAGNSGCQMELDINSIRIISPNVAIEDGITTLTGVTADGETASSTCIYTFVNEHTMTWQSVHQEIAGVAQPDSELVTIVRRAPTPAIDDHVNAANLK